MALTTVRGRGCGGAKDVASVIEIVAAAPAVLAKTAEVLAAAAAAELPAGRPKSLPRWPRRPPIICRDGQGCGCGGDHSQRSWLHGERGRVGRGRQGHGPGG